MAMDTGVYTNIFPVAFVDEPAEFMVCERSAYADLDSFRTELAEKNIQARLLALDDKIYSYGANQSQLDEHSFVSELIQIGEIPELASRLILEGFADTLIATGCTCYWKFGRAILYRFGKPVLSSPQGVNLFRGFEVQPLYLFDPETEGLVYNLAVNVVFTYRDRNNQPVNPQDLVKRFGSDTLMQMRIKQGDLVPNRSINLEVSRQRLVDTTLPFIRKFSEFTLPCGLTAKLSVEPTRIVLSSEAEG